MLASDNALFINRLVIDEWLSVYQKQNLMKKTSLNLISFGVNAG